MRDTYIHYKDKGFWIQSLFIEVLSEYICQAFEEIGLDKFNKNLNDLYMTLDGNRSGEYSWGIVGISFNRTIVTDEDKTLLFNVFSKTKYILEAKAPELTTNELDLWEQRKTAHYGEVHTWRHPIKIQSLIKTIEYFEQLIQETYPYTSHNINYIGFPGVFGDDWV